MPPGLGHVLRLDIQEPAFRHLLARLGEDSPTMRSVLNLDLCQRDTIGPCRAWWPAWPGRPVTHLRQCSTESHCPSAHELHKGKGIKGKRWERRRTLDRRAERLAKGSQVTHGLRID